MAEKTDPFRSVFSMVRKRNFTRWPEFATAKWEEQDQLGLAGNKLMRWTTGICGAMGLWHLEDYSGQPIA